MSSILKALKKVENIPPPEHGDNDLRKRITQSVVRTRSKGDYGPRIIVAGIVLLLVGVFVSVRLFPRKETGPGTPYSSTAPVPKATGEEPAPAGSAEGAPVAATGQSSPPSQAAPRAADGSKPTDAPAPVVPSSDMKPSIAPGPPDDPEALKRSFQPKPLKPSPGARIPPLRLEGIVWSDAPGGRLAMIDGEIVRQGGMVQGVRVIRIAEDHVLVQSRDGTRQKRLTVR